MAYQVHSTIGASAARKETFRTVHEILEEIAEVLETCAEGLGRLVTDPLVTPRHSLMLVSLAGVRAEAADTLSRVVNSSQRPGEGRWLQYASIFSACPNLLSRITATRDGEKAYEVLCEADAELKRAIEQLSVVSASSRELRQAKSILAQLERSSRIVVESALDV